MSVPKELSFDEILNFMLNHNGKVTNHDLVKHFKVFLTNPESRDEARATFKKHVNVLANIKNHNNEKWLILKKKYMPCNAKETEEIDNKASLSSATSQNKTLELEPVPVRPPLPIQLNQDFSILPNLIQNDISYNQDNDISLASNSVITHSASKESLCLRNDDSCSTLSEDVPPKVPRRKHSEKRSSVTSVQPSSLMSSQDSSLINDKTSSTLTTSKSESMLIDGEQKISVKERKQMFNRMASEGDVLRPNPVGNFHNQIGIDEDDRVSLKSEPLDAKQKQWILCAARGDYHVLAKMCKENQKLVKTKDPFTTAMHWACKRGDENLVKLIAGVARQVVNERSNGGYTPLHIAMQFRHENVYRLLIEVYDADPNARDWSGKKPRQYLVHTDTSLSPGCYRKKESFLRIGSLNVRVKKTTEAFSNFLGVGATRTSAYVPKSARESREMDRRSDDDDLHKSWGSADNIQKDDRQMPPPNSSKVKRRGTAGRRGVAVHSRSTPSTPDQPRARIGLSEEGDSDSDSAAGFHSDWRQQRASNIM